MERFADRIKEDKMATACRTYRRGETFKIMVRKPE